MKKDELLWAIDTHAHFGNVEGFPQKKMEKQLCTVSLERLSRYYRENDIRASVISPAEALYPVPGLDILEANKYMEELANSYSWMYQWVVVNPLVHQSYYQAEAMLKGDKCAGVKLHPESHGYPVKDYGDELFAFCGQHHAIVQIHSGEANSMPEDMVVFADRYPDATVICAHLGCGSDGDVEHQIRAVRAAVHGNIYTDVSSAKSILFGLLEWAAGEIGADKMLFGTDTPLHHIGMMKCRVVQSELTDREKQMILHENAEKLFRISIDC